MMEEIIITAITICVPSIATIVTACINNRLLNKNAAKQSILQMIMEDHLAVAEDKLPTNYQNILHEFDIYKKAGGNSYVEDKVTAYKEWFRKQEESRK